MRTGTAVVPCVMRVGIVGGGPAGISAAIWAKRLGLSPILLERKAELGGQLHQISLPISDIPGQMDVSATALLKQLTDHLVAFEIPIQVRARVVRYLDGTLHVADGRTFAVDHVIYAPGLRDRRLKIPGDEWISAQGTSELLASPPQGPVLVVGGGDRALEAACRLQEAGIPVTLVHRHHQFRARPEFRDRLAKTSVRILWDATLQSIESHAQGKRVIIRHQARSMDLGFFTEILVRIGMEPDLEPGVAWRGQESNSGAILVGDAATPSSYRSLVEAYASGMRAAKSLV